MNSVIGTIDSVASGGGGGENGDAVERARRIEDSICSVITNIASASTAVKNEFSSNPSTALYSMASQIGNANSGGALSGEYSTSVVSKHKSMASSLPSLSGVMVNSHLLSSISPPLTVSTSMTIARTLSSITTTTPTRSSRHLQMVGDLPENVLETSCTPPSSPSKLVSNLQHNPSTAHLFTALTPVNMDSHIGNTQVSSATTMANLTLLSPSMEDPNQRPNFTNNSSTTGAVFSANNTAAALTQLFPMATAAATTIAPTYLAVKEIAFSSASPIGGDGSTTTCSATMLSPLQFSLATGNALASPTFTTFATIAGTGSTGLALGSTSACFNSDLLSLQPAAVYVQPVHQNGQMQYVRLELPPNVSLGTSSSGTGKSSVSTVELAHNIIATIFPQPTTSTQTTSGQMLESNASLAVMVNRGQEYEMDVVTCTTMTPTFVLTDQADTNSENNVAAVRIVTESQLNNASGNIHQFTTAPPEVAVTSMPVSIDQNASRPIPATVASRKRTSASRSKDAHSSGNAGSASGEDESDDIYIDTKELCNRIAYELKAYSIPQAVFAERVLCRSQGTLSDLLRNPKPWNKLKSGRETFRRMYVWLKQPVKERLDVLELWKGEKRKSSTGEELPHGEEAGEVVHTENCGEEMPDEISSEDVCNQSGETLTSPRSDEPVASTSSQLQTIGLSAADQNSPQRHQQQRMIKKPRLVFTDIQKRTLQAIFKETQRPSREMQQTIAEHLNLDLSTVQNFFMNARRRSRIEQPEGGVDTPAPFQSVRPITPPPVDVTSASSTGQPKPKQRNLSATASAAKPRSRNRKSEKQKSTDGQQLAASIAFSGAASASEHGPVTLPPLDLHGLDSANGDEEEDVETLLLVEANEEMEAEYMDEEADIRLLQCGESSNAEHANGGNHHIETTTNMVEMDLKPQMTQRWSSALNVYHHHMSSQTGSVASQVSMSRLSEDDELADLLSTPATNGGEPVTVCNEDENGPSNFRPPAPSLRAILAAPIPIPAALSRQQSKLQTGPSSMNSTRSILSPPSGNSFTSRMGFMTPPTAAAWAAQKAACGANYVISPPRRRSSSVSPGEGSLNSLELEAIAAVHELQFAVKDIYVSEMLPRTSELIFLNVTALEGQAYCVELTIKGWRVTSLRHDNMNGDINHLDLHVQYFETIYALMDHISPAYRERFTDALMNKLAAIQAERIDEDDGCSMKGGNEENHNDVGKHEFKDRFEQEQRQTFT